MPPEALLEWLNEMLDVFTHQVLSHQGIITSLRAMALWLCLGCQ
jgi:hypothetical protein